MREGLQALYDHGAHMLPLRGKRPIVDDWLEMERPTVDELLDARRKGADGFGIVPWSIGCAVVDVDHGGDKAASWVITQIGMPLTEHATSVPEKSHLWYPVERAEHNWQWHTPWDMERPAGDIRSGYGHVKMWKPEAALDAAILRPDETPIDLGLYLPKWVNRKRESKPSGPPTPAYRSGEVDRGAETLWAMTIDGLRTSPGGSRNNALNNAGLVLWGLRLAGRIERDARAELVEACESNGLVKDDGLPSVEATIESARRAATPIYSRSRLRDRAPVKAVETEALADAAAAPDLVKARKERAHIRAMAPPRPVGPLVRSALRLVAARSRPEWKAALAKLEARMA